MGANATNIRLGLTITDYQANFKAASAITNQFVSEFKAGFNGLKGSADAPAGAMNSLSRQLTVTKRQIQDLVAVGTSVPTELTQKYGLLQNAANAARGAFALPVSASTPYQALTQRLDEAKTKIRDLAAEGKPVPGVLATEFRGLETQVAKVNREFDKLPTKQEKLTALGGTLSSIGRTASLVTAGIGLIATTTFQSYARINSLQLGLESVTGSAAAAKAEFQQLLPIVRLPGLGLEEAARGDVRLQAIGFSAKEAKKDILELGNAIAKDGGGKFELNSVLTQFTQMSGKAKVLSEDLKPILTASPSIAKAVKDIFGTVDSEQISAKLQAAGKGPKDFIDALILQLSRLERVRGGPANAAENLADSFKLAQFQIGEAADKSFDLTGKLNGLGDLISDTANGFSRLSPLAQGAAFSLVGITATVGPLLIGVGSAINLFNSLTAATGALRVGFLALTGPIALTTAAVAAIGIGAYSIYQFNTALKSTVDTTKLLDGVTKDVTASIAGERGRLESLVSIARDEKETKVARLNAIKEINQISPKYLGGLTLETIGTAKASNALKEYIGLISLRAKAQSAQSKLGEAEVKLEEAQAARRSKAKTASALDAFAATLSNPLELIPGLDNGQGRRDARARTVEREKLAEQDAKKTVDFYKELVTGTQKELLRLGENVEVKAPNFNIISNESDLKKAKDRLKALREEIFAGKKAGKNTTGLEAEAKALNEQIKATNDSLKTQKGRAEGVGSALTTNERILKRLTKELKEQGDNASPALKASVAQFQDLVKAEKELANNKPVDLGDKLKGIEKINGIKQALLDVIDPLNRLDGLSKRRTDIANFNSVGALSSEVQKIQAQIGNAAIGRDVVASDAITKLNEYIKKITEAESAQDRAIKAAQRAAEEDRLNSLPVLASFGPIQILNDSKDKIDEVLQNMKQSIAGTLKETAIAAFAGMGEVVGGLIAGTAGIESLPNLFLGTLGGMLKQLGKIAIEAAAGLIAIKVSLSSLNPAIALAAGIGLIALGTVIQSQVSDVGKGVKAFANGGLVYGPTIGLVGEGIGTTRNNPEVIAPLDKLQSMIGKTRGPEVFITDMILENEHIRVAFNRADARFKELN